MILFQRAELAVTGRTSYFDADMVDNLLDYHKSSFGIDQHRLLRRLQRIHRPRNRSLLFLPPRLHNHHPPKTNHPKEE